MSIDLKTYNVIKQKKLSTNNGIFTYNTIQVY